MSKKTLIIAVVGLVIAAVIGWWAADTIKTVYFAKKGAPRVKYSKEDRLLNECKGNGWVCARDAKGNVIQPKGQKKCKPAESGKEQCVKLYLKKCKEPAFKKSNPTTCKQAAQKAAKMKKDDEGDE